MIEYPKRLATLLLASLFLIACSKPDQQPLIEFSENFKELRIQNINFNNEDDAAKHIQLFILKDHADTIEADQSPIVGKFTLKGNEAIFKPTFNLLAGNEYLVRIKHKGQILKQSFSIPDVPITSIAQVQNVYPTSAEIPLNILKFYIEFDEPMAEGMAYENIHFLTMEGDTLRNVLLSLEQELWSKDMKRLTLLLDPGRIKQGLQSFEELGYSFDIGESYQLVVSKEMVDANAHKLNTDFIKKFNVTEPVYERAGVFEVIRQPESTSNDSLTLKLDRPHDFALLQRTISVFRNNEKIEGQISIEDHETVWKFKPDDPWEPGNYEIRIELILEDLAGNNLLNVFDVDNRKETTQFTNQPFRKFLFQIE